LVRVLVIVWVLLLGGLDSLVADSIIYPWSAALGIAIISLATITGGILVRAGRRRTVVLFAAVALGAMWQLASPWIDKQEVLAHTGPKLIDVQRHFVIGYDDIATVQQLARDGRIGGVFLTHRNVAGRSVAAVAAEIAGLQAIRRAAGLPPLIVAADQEGGPVSHLSPPLPTPRALSAVATLPAVQQSEAARRLGLELGAQLRQIGVTMDLAPVCDLTPRSAPDILDRYTRITTRSISGDPSVTALIASAFSQGLLIAGITPTAKHFPGLARVSRDTHLFGASLAAKETDLQAIDWVPFRAVLDLPGAAVMLSHVSLDAVDAEVPASRSKRIVGELLRKQWGFDGIAITDDLTMGAVEHAGLCRAVEGALNAGIDVLLISWDTNKVYPALRCALDAVDAGRLDPTVLKQSAQRLDRLELSIAP
jgi:beta-N-acetylhexosaminidase